MTFALMDTSAAAAAADASQVSQQAAQQANPWQWVLTIGIWVVVIAAAYFLFIRPQKKRQKAEEELRNSIEIGDDITTIGGIVGRVIAVKEDDETVVIETGSDKTRMRFKKWAIASVDTPEKQPKKETKDDKKADKKADKKEDK
ncbi:MAG: preprotein translocase subunit YajC, partial [Acutalibacteraceae bacterium]|nr:preprotein translocase subunit YajC [Acutalibacteraceae bacterium]